MTGRNRPVKWEAMAVCVGSRVRQSHRHRYDTLVSDRAPGKGHRVCATHMRQMFVVICMIAFAALAAIALRATQF